MRGEYGAKIAAMQEMLQTAKSDPLKLVGRVQEAGSQQRQPHQQQQPQQQTPAARQGAAAVSATTSATTEATKPVKEGATLDVQMVDAQVRPLAELPQVTVQDERHLARLAKAQAVIEHAAQQDVHVELAFRDIGLSTKEVEHLVGEAEWAEKYPKGENSEQPADDWPLPKRMVALVGKAISLVEISTAVRRTAQEAAAAAVSQAAATGNAWQVVKHGRRGKAEQGRQPY